jgi:tetratricopeptide (TPR) repeat protein
MPSLWRRIITEAHRRSVWKVLGVYLVGSWLAYQVVLGLHDGLGLPSWVPAMAVVLFVIGLPIVVATAIVQEGPPGMASTPQPAAAPAPGPTKGPAGNAVSGPGPGPDRRVEPVGELDRHPPFLTWSRSLLAGALAFTLLGVGTAGFMGMRHLGIGPVGTLVARGVLDPAEPVVLADFSGGDGAEGLAAVVAEALRIDLVQSPVIRLADPATVREALERMQHEPGSPLTPDAARELAAREGYKAVITGDVSPLGRSYMLSAQLVAAADGEVLAAFRETAQDDGDIIDAVDRLSRRMRERAGESLRTIRASPPLWQVSTHSVPALRRYSEAERVLRESGDELRAIELLEDAVAIDSTFAMAWRKMASAFSNIGIRAADRQHALTRAYELRDRLPAIERYHAIGSYEAGVRFDHERAAAAYRQVLALDPQDIVALNNLPLALMQLRQFEEAERLLKQAVATGGAPTHWSNLVAVQVALGRVEDARETHARSLDHFPNNVSATRREAMFAVVDGRWDRVDSLAAARRDRFPDNATARATSLLDRIDAAFAEGRLRDADQHRRELDELAEQAGLAPQLLASAIWDAQAAALVRGDPEGALRRLDEALRRFPLESVPARDRPYLYLARAFADAGRLDRAEAMMAEYEAAGLEVQRSDVNRDLVRARIALQRGNAAEALELLQRVTRTGGCLICGVDDLGRAYDMLGQADSARAAYERFLTTPQMGRLFVESFARAPILVRVAELHEEAGDHALARERYAEFLRLWQRADPELQPRVEAVQRRLRAAEGSPR